MKDDIANDALTTVRVYVGALDDALWGEVSPTARSASRAAQEHVRRARRAGTCTPTQIRVPVVEVALMGEPAAVRLVVETLANASRAFHVHELDALIAAATKPGGDADEPAAE